MEANQMASGARFWSKAFRKFLAAMNANPNKEATLLYINSLYQKTGVVYGDPEVIRNGDQLARAKTLSVKFKALKAIQGKTDVGDIVTGQNIVIECVKNKVGVNKRKGNFYYAFVDDGVVPAFKTDVNSQLIDLAMKFGVVERKGAWYIYEDVRVQGLDNFVDEVVSSGVIKDIEAQLDEQLCDTSH
jgi:recombination protein RecA